MHYRSNKLKFQSSKEVKRELQNLNGTYTETMDIYKIIKDLTNNARDISESFEKKIIKNKEDLLKANPHSSIYKILDAIDEFNRSNN